MSIHASSPRQSIFSCAMRDILAHAVQRETLVYKPMSMLCELGNAARKKQHSSVHIGVLGIIGSRKSFASYHDICHLASKVSNFKLVLSGHETSPRTKYYEGNMRAAAATCAGPLTDCFRAWKLRSPQGLCLT